MMPYAKAPICPQCGSSGVSMVVPIRFRMPASLSRDIKKYHINQKDVKLLYGEWDRATIQCEKCLYSWKMGEQR